ncbi:MAG: hypothetical protein RL257_902 [Actinomycetota bacterium]
MIGNLLVLVALVMHQERNPDGVVQLLNQPPEFFHEDVGVAAVIDGIAAGIEIEKVLRGIHDGVGLNLLAIVVDEDVLHDREQPGLEIGVWQELVPVGYRPESRLLIQILCVFRILRQIVGKGVQHG